jgi:ubiquinone/menaquinone biosynthesis C-methylase UbiE
MYKDRENNFDLYGVDISEKLLDVAKQNGIKTFLCDLDKEKLPFEDNYFDILITGETIEHIVNSNFFLSEINRVLKPKGILILSYPNINTLLGIIMMLFFDLPPMYSARFRSPHVRDWTKKMIKLALKEFGFSVQKMSGSSFFIPRLGTINPLGIAKFFPRWSNSVVVVAQKHTEVPYNKSKNVQI